MLFKIYYSLICLFLFSFPHTQAFGALQLHAHGPKFFDLSSSWKGRPLVMKVDPQSGDGEVQLYWKKAGTLKPFLSEFTFSLKLNWQNHQLETFFNGKLLSLGELKEGKLFLCEGRFARVCRISFSEKYPEKMAEEEIAGPGEEMAGGPFENEEPIYTVNIEVLSVAANISTNKSLEGSLKNHKFQSILPYVLPSPDQEEAGSCLFMATTGALEILVNKGLGNEDPKLEGNTDFSERFLMNLENMNFWGDSFLTQTFEKFNVAKGALLNRDYRFTKGNYAKDDRGKMVEIDDPDAKPEKIFYGTYFNWIDNLPANFKDLLVKTPKILKKDIFVKGHGQWDVGVMDHSTITSIKEHLIKYQAPVVAIYNHFGIWHVALIVGFDDSKYGGNCPFVMSSLTHFKNQGKTEFVQAIEKSLEKEPCQEYGVFFIRDSIYGGSVPYTYEDGVGSKGKGYYSKKIIAKSYDWMRVLGNNAYVLYTEEASRPLPPVTPVTPPIRPPVTPPVTPVTPNKPVDPTPPRVNPSNPPAVEERHFQIKAQYYSKRGFLGLGRRKRTFYLTLEASRPGILNQVETVKYQVGSKFEGDPECVSKNREEDFKCGPYEVPKNEELSTGGALVILKNGKTIEIRKGVVIK